MEMDQQTNMKRQSRSGITNLVTERKERPAPEEPRRVLKKWGAGDQVGISLRLKRPQWLALHEAARGRGTNVTQLILTWLDEDRRKQGLPPVNE